MYRIRLGVIYKVFKNFCMYLKKWRIFLEFEDLLYMYLYVLYIILWREKFVIIFLNICKMNLISMFKEFFCFDYMIFEFGY